MKIYTSKIDSASSKKIVADDMILTASMPTAAGSKMLDGYMSLFDAEAISKLTNAGYGLCGKADVGEFAIDLAGETSYNGACTEGGILKNATAEIVKSGEVCAAITLDVNGSPRRAAAQSGLVCVKPTYGTVSRFGTVPVACSGETVDVMATTADSCRAILDIISGHDDKDGTSLANDVIARKSKAEQVKRIAVITSMNKGINTDVDTAMAKTVASLTALGIEVCEIESNVIAASHTAWNILMCAELCNNVSRYDGVKYGYRAANFSGIDELYTNSRTEAFGELLKTAILFGSETLSTENYMKVYDKALRIRRVVAEEFNKIFESFDAVIMPAVSTLEYTEELISADKHIAFEENFYTAPASISGLPAVAFSGVQLVGKAFSENSLLDVAKAFFKEGK